MDETFLSFCPYCGKRYATTKANPHMCIGCKREYYINPHPCNAVIIENSKKEILLVKRKIDPHKGMWDLPGGFMNLEETAENSVTREIQEELGIVIHDIAYYTSIYDRYFYKGINYYTLCFFYLASLPEKSFMKASDDISSFSFFPKKNIPHREIAFEGVRKILQKYAGITQ